MRASDTERGRGSLSPPPPPRGGVWWGFGKLRRPLERELHTRLRGVLTRGAGVTGSFVLFITCSYFDFWRPGVLHACRVWLWVPGKSGGPGPWFNKTLDRLFRSKYGPDRRAWPGQPGDTMTITHTTPYKLVLSPRVIREGNCVCPSFFPVFLNRPIWCVLPVKRHRGEPGHTRDTRDYRIAL